MTMTVYSHAKTPRANNLAGGLVQSRVRKNPDLWGAGRWPVVAWQNWLGAVARAHRQGIAHAFRARAGFPSSEA